MAAMISRRAILASGLAVLAAPAAGLAQSSSRPPTVAILGTPRRGALPFEDAMRELGWIEGRTIVFDRRSVRTYEELPRIARELVALRVDVIVCSNAPAIQAAKRATETIPIVMSASGDPVAAGFVASLSRPGGNITGMTIMHTELSGKRLELLAEAVPGTKRFAVLLNPRNPSSPAMRRETQTRARALGVELLHFEAIDADDLRKVFTSMAQRRVGGVVVPGDPYFYTQTRAIVALARQHRLPDVYEWADMAVAGGLLGYGPSRADLWRRSAVYVDKILRGAKPADLAVEQPTAFELAINLKTARALDLVIPPSLLLRADQVIE